MSMLEKINLLEVADPKVVHAIESLDTMGNPTQLPNRKNDLDVLACLGDFLTPERIVFATDNAILMLLFQRLPGSSQEVAFIRSDFATASLTAFASLADTLITRPENTHQRSSALVIDIWDIHRHANRIESELRSGQVTQVWVLNSLCSYARTWMETVGEGIFEHMPYSRGLSIANLTPAQCTTLANTFSACAQESRWIPSTLNTQANKAARLNVAAMKWLTETIGSERNEHESLLCGLSNRINTLMEQIWTDLGIALPHVDLSPPPAHPKWTRSWKKDIASAARMVEGFLSDHPRNDLFIAMMSNQREQVIRRAHRVIEASSNILPKDLLIEAAHLACGLYHIREQIWWMRDWDASKNLTWDILVNRQCVPGTLGPKPVKPLQEYLDLYWFKGARNAAQNRTPENVQLQTDFSQNQQLDHRLPLLDSLNHTTRRTQAAELCSLMLHRLGAQFPNETIRWLDVGCGNGKIANAARIPDWLQDRIEIIGLDFGEGMIQHANRTAAKHRRYMVANALTPPEELMGMRFHLVSAFEFLEHLIDPVALLKDYATLRPEIMVAGSPLNEQQPTSPAREHTWSFAREGYEAMFKAAGMQIQYSSEVRIGSYHGGHDWLTVAGGFGDGIKRDLPADVRKQFKMHSV
ncbi:MAG: class I SAM-dependent methyltransferase [Phycisphaerales bacterium]